MGCAHAQKQSQYPPLSISNSAGVLKITLNDGVISHQAGVFKMDPYVILKLSNQRFQSKVIAKGGKKPIFGQSFAFFINSNFKEFGRTLQITLMDKKKIGSDNFVGYGIVDLNPIINQKKPRQQFRIMLNYDYKQAGFINVMTQFIEQHYEILHFRFEQAIIRRNTSTFGSMKCWVQVTIGQQIMQTSKQKDSKEKPPMWLHEALTFKVLNSIKQCQIRVMDDDKEIGHILTTVDKFVSSNIQQSFSEDFIYEDGIHAGTLKFQTIKGKAPSFEFKNLHRKTILNSKREIRVDGYFSQKVFQTTLPPNPYISQPPV